MESTNNIQNENDEINKLQQILIELENQIDYHMVNNNLLLHKQTSKLNYY